MESIFGKSSCWLSSESLLSTNLLWIIAYDNSNFFFIYNAKLIIPLIAPCILLLKVECFGLVHVSKKRQYKQFKY